MLRWAGGGCAWPVTAWLNHANTLYADIDAMRVRCWDGRWIRASCAVGLTADPSTVAWTDAWSQHRSAPCGVSVLRGSAGVHVRVCVCVRLALRCGCEGVENMQAGCNADA